MIKTRHLDSLVTALLVLAGIGAPGCADARMEKVSRTEVAKYQADYAKKIEALVPGMGAADIMARKDPQLELEKMCFAASGPGREAQRQALCNAMVENLGPSAPKPARVWMLRKIGEIGAGEVVPTLAKLLNDSDADIRETTRRALVRNPSARAAETLRKELAATKDNAWRIAVVNAIGERRDAAAVPALARLATAEDETVARAAVAALGNIGNPAAFKVLGALLDSAPPTTRRTVVDANLRAAEGIAAQGDRQGAAQRCARLMAPAEPEPVRLAAVSTYASVLGEAALPRLLDIIRGSDLHMQMTAAVAAQRIPGQTVTEKLAAALDGAAPDAQITLLNVLGHRGCPVALPAVLRCAKSPDADVRLAAIQALQFVGDASTVGLLADIASRADGAEADAARRSLNRLRGAGVDEATLAAMQGAAPPVRRELVKAAAARRIVAAKDTFFAAAADPDEGVRVAALSALAGMAAAPDYPRLVAILVKSSGNATMQAAEEAVAAVGAAVGEEKARVGPLVSAMADAPVHVKVSLIHVLKRFEGPSALAAVREASRVQEKAVSDAALEAISRWSAQSCDTWLFSGPYDEKDKKHTDLFDMAFAPEKGENDVRWRPLDKKFQKQPGLFELHRLVKDRQNCCGYVKTRVWSAKEQKAQFSFGSDDGVKAWLNGTVIHANNATRACKCDEDKVTVTLKEGWNDLMLKITQGGADWSFCCGIRAADGGPLDDLKFEVK